ncbi:MAG: hypothetical protein M3358_14840 [Actinomycetota bacterium]|jgi:hypothetical protein|nr:hypothetical protein [Actinomycetota bacterium]
MAKARWTLIAILAALVVAMLALGGAASAQWEGATTSPSATVQTEESGGQLRVEKPGGGYPGPLSPAQQQAISRGYLVPDEEAYEQAKAEAAEKAEQLSAERPEHALQATTASQIFRSWEGIRDPRTAPSDSTGAIGPTRYIELINLRYAIYDRTNNTPIDTGELNELAGEPPRPRADIFDPQIIWDPTTRRFYYVADDVISATDNRLAFGFSKTASPSSAADFCKYTLRFGSRFPDYPKLGDTRRLLLIGVNSFAGDTPEFLGVDLISITKPPAGSGCPNRGQFTVDTETDLRDADGRQAWTPVPANQIDTSDTGFVVAEAGRVADALGSANFLNLYRVTKRANGTMDVSSAKRLLVPPYNIPANAPQPGSRYVLDTLDARNTQAITAFDPSPGEMALWTQHTVFGGSGAQVRWYEIDPTFPFPSLLQRGSLGSLEGTFFFNAAISPDRQVSGGTRRFGDAMVMGYNTSSKSHRPDIRMISKVGAGPASGQTLIKSSPAVLEDWSCFPDFFCRWGDYSAATPDPRVPEAATTGRVWLTNQWVKAQGVPDRRPAKWGTWNWAATP